MSDKLLIAILTAELFLLGIGLCGIIWLAAWMG